MSGFTQIELDTLQWLADGKQQTHIAVFRGVTTEMVKRNVNSIKEKLEAETMAHAVAIAIRKGIIQ